MHVPNLIHGLTFDIAFDGTAQASDALAAWLRTVLLPVLDDVLTLQQGARRIERLELDLGTVGREDADTELPRRLFAQLSSALGWSEEQATERSVVAAREQKAGEQLLGFLRSGRLAWSTASDRRGAHHVLLRKVLGADDAAAVLGVAVRNEDMVTRLVRQFDAALLLEVTAVLAGGHPQRDRIMAEARAMGKGTDAAWRTLLQELVTAVADAPRTRRAAPDGRTLSEAADGASAGHGRYANPATKTAMDTSTHDPVPAQLVAALEAGDIGSIKRLWPQVDVQYREVFRSAWRQIPVAQQRRMLQLLAAQLSTAEQHLLAVLTTATGADYRASVEGKPGEPVHGMGTGKLSQSRRASDVGTRRDEASRTPHEDGWASTDSAKAGRELPEAHETGTASPVAGVEREVPPRHDGITAGGEIEGDAFKHHSSRNQAQPGPAGLVGNSYASPREIELPEPAEAAEQSGEAIPAEGDTRTGQHRGRFVDASEAGEVILGGAAQRQGWTADTGDTLPEIAYPLRKSRHGKADSGAARQALAAGDGESGAEADAVRVGKNAGTGLQQAPGGTGGKAPASDVEAGAGGDAATVAHIRAAVDRGDVADIRDLWPVIARTFFAEFVSAWQRLPPTVAQRNQRQLSAVLGAEERRQLHRLLRAGPSRADVTPYVAGQGAPLSPRPAMQGAEESALPDRVVLPVRVEAEYTGNDGQLPPETLTARRAAVVDRSSPDAATPEGHAVDADGPADDQSTARHMPAVVVERNTGAGMFASASASGTRRPQPSEGAGSIDSASAAEATVRAGRDQAAAHPGAAAMPQAASVVIRAAAAHVVSNGNPDMSTPHDANRLLSPDSKMPPQPALVQFREWQHHQRELSELALSLPELKQWLTLWLMHDTRLVNQDCSLMLEAIESRCAAVQLPEMFMKQVLITLRAGKPLDLDALAASAGSAPAVQERPAAMDAITTLTSQQAIRNFVAQHRAEDAQLRSLNSAQLHQLVRAWMRLGTTTGAAAAFLPAIEEQALSAYDAHAYFGRILHGLLEGGTIDLEHQPEALATAPTWPNIGEPQDTATSLPQRSAASSSQDAGVSPRPDAAAPAAQETGLSPHQGAAGLRPQDDGASQTVAAGVALPPKDGASKRQGPQGAGETRQQGTVVAPPQVAGASQRPRAATALPQESDTAPRPGAVSVPRQDAGITLRQGGDDAPRQGTGASLRPDVDGEPQQDTGVTPPKDAATVLEQESGTPPQPDASAIAQHKDDSSPLPALARARLPARLADAFLHGDLTALQGIWPELIRYHADLLCAAVHRYVRGKQGRLHLVARSEPAMVLALLKAMSPVAAQMVEPLLQHADSCNAVLPQPLPLREFRERMLTHGLAQAMEGPDEDWLERLLSTLVVGEDAAQVAHAWCAILPRDAVFRRALFGPGYLAAARLYADSPDTASPLQAMLTRELCQSYPELVDMPLRQQLAALPAPAAVPDEPLLAMLLMRADTPGATEKLAAGLLLRRLLDQQMPLAGALESALSQPDAIERLVGIAPTVVLAELLTRLVPELAAQLPAVLNAMARHIPVANVPAMQGRELWHAIYQSAFVAADPVTPEEFIRALANGAGVTGPLPPAVAAATPAATLQQLLQPLAKPAPETPSPVVMQDDAEPFTGEANILNAGMVIFATYMQRLFNILELTRDGTFVNDDAAQRAVHLLQYAVNGETETPEYQLVLNKLFCGIHGGVPIIRGIDITDKEKDVIEQMLNGVIGHWSALGKTSIAGLRETFLQRQGHLSFHDEAWHLKIPQATFDMLLDRLPWSFAMIRFPWMGYPLHVSWR